MSVEWSILAHPKSHWSQIHSINPIKRFNREFKRRTNVVKIFANETAIAMVFKLVDGAQRRWRCLDGMVTPSCQNFSWVWSAPAGWRSLPS